MDYFNSYQRLKITPSFVYDASSSGAPSPPWSPELPKHNKTGNTFMRMISEKVIALLLAVFISGAAFNTFIV
jgi:hypothetical protein